MPRLLPADPQVLARVLRGVAVAGVVTGLLVIVVGNVVVGRADLVVAGSLDLTADTLEAVDASLEIGDATVTTLAAALDDVRGTTDALVTVLEDADGLFTDTADLLRDDVATTVTSVEQSLPALIETAGTVDTALRALAALPLGLSYDPDEPFDVALARLQDSLDGLPERLVEQADAIEAAGSSLRGVTEGVLALVDVLASLTDDLAGALGVLEDYGTTSGEARALVADARDALGGQLVLARVTVVLLGLVLIASQLVPLTVAAGLTAGRR